MMMMMMMMMMIDACVIFSNTSAHAQKSILREGRRVDSVIFSVYRSNLEETLTEVFTLLELGDL